MKVYVIVHTVIGPSGHGEPGDSYFCLRRQGPYYSGSFDPAFTSLDAAQSYIQKKQIEDKWFDGKICELDVME